MNKNDAATFPLLASGALFSLYAAFKYFNEDVVKELIFFYLVIVSSFSMAGCINLYLENVFPKTIVSVDSKKGLLSIMSLLLVIKMKFDIRVCDIISYAIAFAIGFFQFVVLLCRFSLLFPWSLGW